MFIQLAVLRVQAYEVPRGRVPILPRELIRPIATLRSRPSRRRLQFTICTLTHARTLRSTTRSNDILATAPPQNVRQTRLPTVRSQAKICYHLLIHEGSQHNEQQPSPRRLQQLGIFPRRLSIPQRSTLIQQLDSPLISTSR